MTTRTLHLTTTRDGSARTTTLPYLPDGERVLLLADGDDGRPDWFRDLLAAPRVTVDNGVSTYDADAVVLDGAERERILARVTEADPSLAGRDLAAVALHEVPGPPRFNAESLGAALRLLHGAFRRELALVREEVAAAGPRLGAQLRVNCLTVCHGLHYHHRSEDGGIFPFLEDAHPDLAPTIAQLRAEHEQLAALLDQLQGVVSGDEVDAAAVAGEVDRLSDRLEAHLRHEEQALLPALDAVTW